MNIDLVLKRLELIKEGKGIGTISDIEAGIILNKIERLKSNEKTLADLLDKEQKKNKKVIEYIEYKKGLFTKDVVQTKVIADLLEILKGDGSND